MANKKKVLEKRSNRTHPEAINNDLRPAEPFFAIGIGASAGGINAINELVWQLPQNLNAAVFIVLHLSKMAVPQILIDRIKSNTKLVCKIAIDNDTIEPGTIYLAAPDAHLLVKNDHIVIGHGPEENRFRPSIDVLFRSIAAAYGERSIGIILTGFLNDGTVGMNAIKQSAGHTIVQDPNEAEYPDMPLSVLETMEADHCISLKAMGDTILEIIKNKKVTGAIPPEVIIKESRISEKVATGIDKVSNIGRKSLYACPDCGGGLWQIDQPAKHYRCHIGHSYSEKDLLLKQAESIENTLWVSVRMMEERKILLQKNAKSYYERGLKRLSSQQSKTAEQLDSHIGKLKQLLFEINKD